MRGLDEAANKTGGVVNLINDIVGQTNPLSLNATIEAPRTGAASAQELDSASQLSAQAEGLRGEVEKFLADVRAA